MDMTPGFIDVSGRVPREQEQWPSLIMRRAAIEREIERLASEARPPDGCRASAFNHPMNKGRIPAYAPGIEVLLQVLKPGEETAPVMRNSSLVEICIGGQGELQVGSQTLRMERHDVWNVPSFEPLRYRNTGQDLFVRLSYSNAPVLEFLETHYTDRNPEATLAREKARAEPLPGTAPAAQPTGRARDAATPIPVGKDGAQLLGYEWLVDIDNVDSRALLWPWKVVESYLPNVKGLDLGYTGRHLYLLYNPATERRMGTSHHFFATIAMYPPEKVDRAHRHTSASINYIMSGKGKSVVGHEKMEWEAGDLHFSAPGWAVHNHGSREQGFIALTVQDHPLHLAMESLLWQETLQERIQKLGSGHTGVQTNLDKLKAA